MKLFKTIAAVATLAIAFCIASPVTHAQTLSVSGLEYATTTTGGSITGAVTVTNSVIDGITNQANVITYYGGFDKSNNPFAWSQSVRFSGSLTNNQLYTNSITGLLPGQTVYFNTEVVDLFTGSAFMSASGSFTTSTQTNSNYEFLRVLSGFASTSAPPAPALSTASFATTNLPLILGGNATNSLFITNGIVRGSKTGWP